MLTAMSCEFYERPKRNRRNHENDVTRCRGRFVIRWNEGSVYRFG